MKMKRIIRIETVEGIGMYYESDALCTDAMQEEMRHPMPYDDEKLCKECSDRDLPYPTSGEWYFGFGSKRQARFWVYKAKWLRELHADGLVVSEYLCRREDVSLGDTQAMFLKHESKVSHNLLSYFGIKA